MSSPNGKPVSERMSDHRSSRAESPRRRRSYSRDRGEKRRERRDHDDRKKTSRSRDRHRGERSDRRSRSHDRSHHRDKDRDRERRRERDEREGRHRDKDRDKDDRDRRERRRKREEDPDAIDEDRHKRKRDEKDLDVTTAGVNDDNVSVSRSDRRDRSHDSERRQSERYSRRSREDYDDVPPRRRDDREPRKEIDRGFERRIDRDRRALPRDMEDDPEIVATPPRPAPPSPPVIRRPSPQYEPPPDSGDEPVVEDEDSEARSVFVSQLAARLTARDLGYFFEDKLGDGTVKDSRIVTDRLSRRSKGIGYVEFRSIELVPRAIALSGTIVMGLPIMVQLTESERNKLHPGDGSSINLPPGVSASSHGSMQIYVGSLHFNLTESDIKQVFEPFGDLDFVDLHRDPMTGRSKGFCFIQYKRPEDARMALEQMEGFELAGRTLRVKTVHEKGTARLQQQDSLDEAGGGNLNAASRQALMQKLARIDPPPTKTPDIMKPNIPQQQSSRCVLLKNMFTPEDETERDWDKDLAEDVKGECEQQYGKVDRIKVEKESQGEIYVKFGSVETAEQAFKGLNGRWFGGKQVSAHFISDAIMQAHQ
ncbi:hypothetical protein JB92DRAFT_2804066 [Gautieria morchelliformis]|nr:hypothetical protein JB92DRAFT_2804066 [Gautieria morchelliformis]